MTVIVTKPAVNLREELAALNKPSGIVGESILRAETAADAVEQLNLEDHTFTTFTSTGIDDNATSTKLNVSNTGIDVTGDITLGDINPTITFNDSSVTNLSHTISSASDNLKIQVDANGVDAGSRVEIFDGTTEVARFSAGALDVTGTITADGLTVDGDVQINGSFPRIWFMENDTTDLNAQLTSSSGALKLFTTNDAKSTFKQRLGVDHATGAISFYEDTGTNVKFLWDSGDERLTLDGDGYASNLASSTSASVLELNPNSSSSSSASWFGGVSGGAQYVQVANGTGTTAYDFLINPYGGNVGIGTTLPLSTMHLSTTGGGSVYLQDSDATSTYNISEISNNAGNFNIQTRNSSGTFVSTDYQIVKNASGADYHRWFTQGSERMRVTDNGALVIGKTETDSSLTGIALESSGRLMTTRSSQPVGYFMRTTTEGEVLQINSLGSTVGSIGTRAESVGKSFYITYADAGLKFYPTNDCIMPCTYWGADKDDFVDLGASSARFDDIYATNGTIQTSDANEKQDIAELDEAEKRVATAAKGLIRKFRWISSVEEKGDAARIHVGVIAQDLQAAFEAEGLDPGRYGMFISSTWWEVEETYTDDDGIEQTRINNYHKAEDAPEGAIERTRLGVRYNQLLAFIISAL